MTSVKYFHSAMTGAPTLSGTAGALIAVLDACLVNGFGSGTVDSIVVTDGIATVTRSAGHPFEVDSIAEIAGSTPSALNGQKRVLSVPNINTYTFDATGVSNQTATGTITHKLAGAGWTKAFAGTNVAAYRSPNVAGTQEFLRVDDTPAQDARVVGYENMTDVNTGTGPFPTNAQVSGGGWWGKSNAASAVARPWLVIADDRTFYLAVAWNNGTTYATFTFGDINSFKAPDPFACTIVAGEGTLVGLTPGAVNYADQAHVDWNVNQSLWLARGVSGVGAPSKARRTAFSPLSNPQNVFSGAGGAVYPNAADNGILVSPFFIAEASPVASVRGVCAGAYFVPQAAGSTAFSVRDKVDGITGFAGRKFMAIPNNTGVMLVDITGPWR